MDDLIKITVKRSELEYCFKAINYDDFVKRFDFLKDIMAQRFINELSKRDIKRMSEYIIKANTGCFACNYAQWDADGCTCKKTGLLVGNTARGCEKR